jgi:hypothetical protein
MALLADLSDFKDNLLTDRYPGADGQRYQIYSLGCQIFSKITGVNIQPQSPHLIDAFYGQQAHLAVRAAIGMSIANKAKLSLQKPFFYVFLLCSLFVAFADSDYSGHAYMTIIGLTTSFFVLELFV